MDILQAMKERHSVRRYTDKPIEPEKIAEIEKAISAINEETALNNLLEVKEQWGKTFYCLFYFIFHFILHF